MTPDARMPLERPEKPVQAFPGGESYHPTSTDVKLTSSLLIGFKRVDTKTWIRKPEKIEW